MNRRDFLKSIGVVGAGTAVSVLPQLILDKQLPQIKFDEATLHREFNGSWRLNFSSPELFVLRKQSGQNPEELVVEIGDYIFVLKQPKQIDFASTEYLAKGGKIYHIQLVGQGWEQAL